MIIVVRGSKLRQTLNPSINPCIKVKAFFSELLFMQFISGVRVAGGVEIWRIR